MGLQILITVTTKIKPTLCLLLFAVAWDVMTRGLTEFTYRVDSSSKFSEYSVQFCQSPRCRIAENYNITVAYTLPKL